MLLLHGPQTVAPFSLCTAARYVSTAKSLQLRTFLGLGSRTCVCSSALLSLWFLCTGQSCVQVPQRFVRFLLFLGERAPYEYTVAPHCLYTFSGQGNPAGRYCSILLAPPLSSGRGTPCVHSPLRAQSWSICWVTLQVKGALVCPLWHANVSAGSVSIKGG